MFTLANKINPFKRAINTIKMLKHKTTPNQKFQLLFKIKDEICDSVDKYYEANHPESAKKFVIDPDSFLNILIYCLIKSGDNKLLIY
jgi:hypothetical protein